MAFASMDYPQVLEFAVVWTKVHTTANIYAKYLYKGKVFLAIKKIIYSLYRFSASKSINNYKVMFKF